MKAVFLKGRLFSVLLFVSLLSISCGGGGGDSPPPASDTRAPSIPGALVAKFDSSGNWQWTKLLGTAGGESAYGVAAGGGYIYVTGPTTGNLDGNINAGSIDIFLGRYSAAGVKQ